MTNEAQARTSEAGGQVRLRQKDDKWSLSLYGIVGDDFDGFTDQGVTDMLEGVPAGSRLEVHINSPGGVVHQGTAVHNALASYQGDKEVIVDGLAASMGSVIAMAGDRVRMFPGSMMMIHNPWNIAMGDSQEMRKNADMLDKIRESMLAIYERKSGQDRETLTAMMDEETWLTAEEAVEWGFADEVIETDASAPAAIADLDLSILPNIPDSVARVVAQHRIAGQSRDARAAEPAVTSTPEGGTDMSDVESPKKAAEQTAAEVTTEATTETKEPQMSDAEIRAEAVKAERQRVSDIQRCVRAAGLDSDFANSLIEEGISANTAKDRIFDKMQESQVEVQSTVRASITRDEKDSVREGMAKAIIHRYNPGAVKIEGDDPARPYAHMRLLEMARALCDSNSIDTRGMTPQRVARAALHSTSDFPAITENVIGKMLRDSYELAPRTFTVLGRSATLPDFKEVSRVQMGEAPKLQPVLEGGEYTHGTIGEAAERYRLIKYGKIVAITWETIINDDLDAFTRVPAMMGASAGQLESDLFWDHVGSNPTMHDGNALFSADHGNLADPGAAIDVDSIGEGRRAMRRQKGLDGEHRINVQARYLVVPSALETRAEQFVSTNLQPNTSGEINPFAGRLEVVSEPRLDDVSEEAWHLWADPAMVDTVEYAYLQGEAGPVVETEEGFDRDGISTKVRHCFGVKAVDWRGVYRNPGQ